MTQPLPPSLLTAKPSGGASAPDPESYLSGGVYEWFTAGLGEGKVGGTVDTLEGQKAGKVLAAPSAAERPLSIIAGGNSRAGIQFSKASSQVLRITSGFVAHGSGDNYLLLVGRWDTTSNWETALQTQAVSGNILTFARTNSGNDRASWGGAGVESAGADTNIHTWEMYRDVGTDVTIQRDGGTPAIAAYTPAGQACDKLSIGKQGNDSQPCSFTLLAAVFCDGIPTGRSGMRAAYYDWFGHSGS